MDKINEKLFALCKDKNTDEYHIFETRKNADICTAKSKTSICGAAEVKDQGNCVSVCVNAKAIKIKAAEIGNQVCGNCMKIIFKTED